MAVPRMLWGKYFQYERDGEAVLLDPVSLDSVFIDSGEVHDLAGVPRPRLTKPSLGSASLPTTRRSIGVKHSTIAFTTSDSTPPLAVSAACA